MTFDYKIELLEKMTEEELADGVSKTNKMAIQWCIEHNPEKDEIILRPGCGDCIVLHGAQDARDFIEAIEDTIQQMFSA